MRLPRHITRFVRAACRPAPAGLAAAGLLAALTAAPVTRAQEAPALEPVTFTSAQVSRGRQLYGGNCASCHGEDLAGLDAPALSGDFFTHWYGGPVADLFDYIQIGMPANNPGSLTPVQVAGLVAFILQRNGFAAGDTPLPEDAETLRTIGFTQP